MLQDIFGSYGFELDTGELAQFENFLQLFQEYNAHTNLSAIRDEEGIVVKHFVDSLYGASLLPEGSLHLLDIGSGGGFPGIPLKIVYPDLEVTLLDSVGKKVKATQHFIEKLGLSRIHAIQDRAEQLATRPEHRASYDVVVSRATAYITDILRWAKPFLKSDGIILLYKMPSDEEIRDREKILKKLGLSLVGELPYSLAGKDRVIYMIKRKK